MTNVYFHLLITVLPLVLFSGYLEAKYGIKTWLFKQVVSASKVRLQGWVIILHHSYCSYV